MKKEVDVTLKVEKKNTKTYFITVIALDVLSSKQIYCI